MISCSRSVIVHADSDVETAEEVIIDPLRIRSSEIVSSMSESLLASQLLITGIDGNTGLLPHMIELLSGAPAGGIMFFRYNLNTNTGTIRSLISQCSSLIINQSGIAPFIAVDHEGGTVNRLPRSVASLPSASSYWDVFKAEGEKAALSKLQNDSFKAGAELNDLGFNMNFAPVAEHLIDENRDFLAMRSYGPNPGFTAKAASLFMQSMAESGVLCVLKHFPGSAGHDPHYAVSVLNTDEAGFDILVYPFREAVNKGARAVMAAHTSVPFIDDKIASLSPVFLNDILRVSLKFDGIIISDDFIMTAAGNLKPEDATVLSIIAGSDMVLVWPPYLRSTHRAIMTALEDGRLSYERLQEAAQRIIYEKLLLGIIE
ncbi:MAG: glycoside hydrolase family 3 protein [Treponema sp.]|nr:glycoside hydrolase family 3 protein [Treponema sp.]